MYTVLLAVKNNLILHEVEKTRVWGEMTGFTICEVTSDYENLLDKLRETRCHLVLMEAVPDYPALAVLRTIKEEKLCKAVAFISQNPEFKLVRKSFLFGVDDFFAVPFESSQFISLFSRIENAEHGKMAVEICKKEELLEYFEHVDGSIREYLDKLLYNVFSEYLDYSEAFGYFKRLMESVITELFTHYAWLRFYFAPEDYIPQEDDDPDYESMIQKGVTDFYSLFLEFAELYPAHGEETDQILDHILNRPDGDLRQKTISEELYMNRSYLSTVFSAQVGINFVEYTNTVKMKRAAYLLKHTEMKVIDIAGTLDYKDMGYFLKKFKGKYGMTPSQYRIPENYEFQI